MSATLNFLETDAGGTQNYRQGIPDASNRYAPSVTLDGTIPTYTWAAGGITPLATPESFLQIAPPTVKSLRLRALRIFGTCSSPGGMTVTLNRTSDVGTPNASTTYTTIDPSKRTTTDASPTATVKYIQGAALDAEPTVVAVEAVGVTFLTDGSVAPVVFEREWGTLGDEAFVLVGASDYLYLSFNGDAVPADGSLFVEVVGQEV